jgi:hypothetical protein
MSWVNDLGSGLGILAGAATLVGAMYAACAVAEKAARPEALHDIARILKNPLLEQSVQVPSIVSQVFQWTFGRRHVSWKCITRSIIATYVFVVVFAFIFGVQEELYHRGAILGVLFLGGLPGYLSLAKARLLLRRIERSWTVSSSFLSLAYDVGLSLLISLCWVSLFGLLYRYSKGYDTSFAAVFEGIFEGTRYQVRERSILDAVTMSTLLTSLWTLFILLATIVLRFITPLHRLTTWFFDVEKHPVQAIGILTGALVLIGSLILSVIRALI